MSRITWTPSKPSVAQRVPVADFDNYPDAERAVDRLSDNGFPVEHRTIVGVGLRITEDVLGRLTVLRAAGLGALAGRWFGLLVGVFLAIFSVGVVWWLATVLWALLWGAIAGAVFGAVAHLLSGGRRDFFSSSTLTADRYEVVASPEYADRARGMLADPGTRHEAL